VYCTPRLRNGKGQSHVTHISTYDITWVYNERPGLVASEAVAEHYCNVGFIFQCKMCNVYLQYLFWHINSFLNTIIIYIHITSTDVYILLTIIIPYTIWHVTKIIAPVEPQSGRESSIPGEPVGSMLNSHRFCELNTI
jgi:hypothetical protein